MLSVSVVFWVLYLASLVLYAIAVRGTPGAVYFFIPALLVDTAAQFAVGLCILLLVDRHGGIFRLIKRLATGKPMSSSSSGKTTRTSSSSQSSRFQTKDTTGSTGSKMSESLDNKSTSSSSSSPPPPPSSSSSSSSPTSSTTLSSSSPEES